jgi:hypothetical protein
MPTDPRLVIKNLFEPSSGNYKVTGSNLLLEDGSTVAKHECDYEYNPAVMSRLMLENPHVIDLFFIIIFIDELAPDMTMSGPICYNYVIGVQAVTIYKYNSDRSVKVNGDKLARQAKEEIRRVIRENPYGSLRDVRGTRKVTARVGDSLIWGDIMEILYKQYTSTY